MRRGAAKPLSLWDTGRGIEIEMVYVPPGPFIMGSERGAHDEQPQHAHPMPAVPKTGTAQVIRPATTVISTVPGPAKPSAAASRTPEIPAPKPSAAVQQALEASASAYLKTKYAGQIQNLEMTAEASASKRRGVVEAHFMLDGQAAQERLLAVEFTEGWQILRPLKPGEDLDWSTGNLIRKK
jgi:hypothetical protein